MVLPALRSTSTPAATAAVGAAAAWTFQTLDDLLLCPRRRGCGSGGGGGVTAGRGRIVAVRGLTAVGGAA